MHDEKLERILRKGLHETEANEPAWDDAWHGEVMDMFERKLRIARIMTWGTLAVTLPVTLFWFLVMGITQDTKLLIFGLVFILGAGQVEVLMKLWYWIVQSRMQLQQEIKELRLHVAQLQLQIEQRDRS